MQTNEIRKKFLDFFSEKDHLVVPSYPLIPQDDPTLLLIGAGMAPLKPYFTGDKKPPHPRMATCQKCVRTPDIELVGITGRHATFFEMLGNFSFGDYFKEEAIKWAWEFVTEKLGLPMAKLWISVYEEDDEAFEIWQNKIGLPPDRIIRLGKKDNFWEIGPGPCGPCSEIYFDLGPEAGCQEPGCALGCDCDRYLEIWNLVFTQYNRMPDGGLVPLKRKNIDTGAGLERMAVVMQGKKSLFEIDTVKPILDYIDSAALPGTENNILSRKIVAEHLRGITFMVGDGVLPSNEGRGYVLRRLLRRAIRHGRLLGIDETFLCRAVPLVVSLMKETYPELGERENYITQIVELEENRFRETLNQGMEILETYLADNMQKDENKEQKVFPGELAFRLYDTYGFPLDLTREILAEKQFSIEEEAFNKALQEQKEKARKAHKSHSGPKAGDENGKCWEATGHLTTTFEGYDKTDTASKIIAICKHSSPVETLSENDRGALILEKTPFYAESGGQTGDTGTVSSEKFVFDVENTYYNKHDQIVHEGIVKSGNIKIDEPVISLVNLERRQAICRSHTTTHLLHRVLKDLLGSHVNQAGSQVMPDRLRFDFTHFKSITTNELKEIEIRLNKVIRDNLSVHTSLTKLDNARKMGAMALFDEKYGSDVRVVKAGDFSAELCGGTHLSYTGQAGLARIVREESIGAGVRRVEALTGEEAWLYMNERENILKRVADALKTSPENIDEKITDLIGENRKLQHDYLEAQRQLLKDQGEKLIKNLKTVNDIKVISNKVSVGNMDLLRDMADNLKENLSRSVIVLGAVNEDKVMLVSAVTADIITEGIHAGKLIGEVARKVGGGGGGRPDMAQAGGKKPENLPEALEMVYNLVENQQKTSKEKSLKE